MKNVTKSIIKRRRFSEIGVNKKEACSGNERKERIQVCEFVESNDLSLIEVGEIFIYIVTHGYIWFNLQVIINQTIYL